MAEGSTATTSRQPIYTSPLPPVSVPDTSLTGHVLGGAAERDGTALVDASTGERLDYRALARAVSAGADLLRGRGVGPGDTVALIAHNEPYYAVALHAALHAGATVMTTSPLQTPEEIHRRLAVTRSRLLIADDGVPGRNVPLVRLRDLRAAAARPGHDATPPAPVAPDSTALLLFSSGTTGSAKPVMLTHRGLVANIEQTLAGWPLTEADVQLAGPPFSHAYGMTIVLNCGLRAGATVVTTPRFDPADWFATVARYRVTRGYAVPPMLRTLVDCGLAARHDLSSLVWVMCGAAPSDLDLLGAAEQALGCPVRQGYGMTEAGPGTHQVFDRDLLVTPPDCVGTLSAGTIARVVDPETGVDRPPGQIGELLIQGPQVMAGYLGEPAATAASFLDGWLRTGDLVRVDEHGRFRIVDRLKDMIKCNGYQVTPAELEAVLRRHGKVSDVAVVGVPDPVRGEEPLAFVVLSGEVAAEELSDWVNARVARYARLRRVVPVTAIPRSPTGKVLRRVLRDEMAAPPR